MHQTILQQAFESNTTIVLLQEPYMPRIYDSSGAVSYVALHHPAVHTLLPGGLASTTKVAERPRVIAYFHKGTLEFSPVPVDDLDIQLIKVFGKETFLILNLYNEKRARVYTDHHILPTVRLDLPTIIVGDFNRHYH